LLAQTATENAPAPAPLTFVRTIGSAPGDRLHQRVMLASADEAKQLGMSAKEIYAVRLKGDPQPKPVQWDERTKAPYFLVASQAGGQALEATVTQLDSYQSDARVEPGFIDDQFAMILVDQSGRTATHRLFGFQHEESVPPGIKPIYRRAGFIHPVLTPKGEIISGSFAPDHAHHHGIWTAWSHTEFQGRHPDFWNVHEETGRVEYLGLGQRWIGPVDSGFHAKMRSLDTKTNPATEVLAETWRITAYPTSSGPNVFELEVTQRNTSSDPLVLTKHIYGGLGYRGLESWTATAPLTFLTSEGHVGRKAGDGQRVRWFAFAGPTEHGRGGIAILSHPDNLNYPQWTRFNPKDPFVAFTPVHDGPVTVAPDQVVTQRFRFLTFDGEPDAKLIESYWNGFANPAQATAR